MGNRLGKVSFSFSDSNWRNSLNVITTNVESEINGDGDGSIAINSNDNATDMVGRSGRSIDAMSRDFAYWDAQVKSVMDSATWEKVNRIPLCEWIFEALFILNVIMITILVALTGE